MPKQNHLFHIHCNVAQACSYLWWYTGDGEGEKKNIQMKMKGFFFHRSSTGLKPTCLILCWSASCCLEELLWVTSARALAVFCGRLFYTLTVSHLELQLHHSDDIFTGLPSNFMVVAQNIPYFNHLPNKTPKKQTLCKDILNPFWTVGGFLKICLK